MPTDVDDLLAALSRALPEPPAAAGERMLGAVLDAWSPPRRRRPLMLAPRTLLAAVLIVLVGGSLAYAFGGRVVNAVTGGPAPPKIKQDLARLANGSNALPRDGAPPWQQQLARINGKLVKGSERRELTIPTSWHGSASLYVGRTTSGGYCVLAGWAKSGLAGTCAPTEHYTDPGRPIALGTLAATMGRDRMTSANYIRGATDSALLAAAEVGANSIAYPALGAGVGRFPIRQVAELMVGAVLDCRSSGSIDRVVFVVRDFDTMVVFEEAISRASGA